MYNNQNLIVNKSLKIDFRIKKTYKIDVDKIQSIEDLRAIMEIVCEVITIQEDYVKIDSIRHLLIEE